MHPAPLRASALGLIAAGINDCEVARFLGLPRTTVRDMRRAAGRPGSRPRCPRCWRPTAAVRFTDEDYAELLGLYLGDGHIAEAARAQRLRLSLDARYPNIVADTEALLRRCFPGNRVGRVLADRGATIIPNVYHAHLGCLFPQAGAGKKHLRRVVLEPWQDAIVARAPWALLRGLIRSDGCVFVNRTGRYAYVSYGFGNLSQDILDLFAATCATLGLSPRRTARDIRLNRREDVAQLLEHVGRKT